MPARSPFVPMRSERVLGGLGEVLRTRRVSLGLSVDVVATASGVSRVTVYRIESGAASVTIGAYLNVAVALGLQLTVDDLQPLPIETVGETQEQLTEEQLVENRHTSFSGVVRVGDYPQLRGIAWQLAADTEVTQVEALHIYERNWRHVDREAMDTAERSFVQYLIDEHGGGVLLV